MTDAALTDRIASLESVARALEPGAADRSALLREVNQYAEDFLESLPERPAYHVTEAMGIGIREGRVEEQPPGLRRALDLLRDHVDGPGLNPASGGHLGYIPGGGIYASALGDFLSDISNRYAGVFFGGPGAVRLENLVTRWVADVVGYPDSAAGVHLAGGSMANLVAIATARDAHGLRGKDYQQAVVYLTSQTHHCIEKSLRVLGLGECQVRQVPLDDRYRMRPDDLDRMILADRAAGLRPWLVVASAGTTDVGAVDPLRAIAEVTSRHGLWYHVDAAYGGFFALTEHGRSMLQGMELSDSVVLDPHKSLFLPYGSGVLLVRDGARLAETHHYEAHYMQDAKKLTDELSPADLSPELTRPFRALRLWLPLMIHGVAPFRAALEEKCLLARYFRHEVARRGFWVGPEPDLSVVVYRYIPERMRAPGAEVDWPAVDRYNEQLVEAIRRDGRVFVSSTQLGGRFTLRIAVVVHRTHLATIHTTLTVLDEMVERLGR